MVLSVEQQLKLKHKLARRKAKVGLSGESATPVRHLDYGMGGGGLSVSSLPNTPMFYGKEVAYIAIPSMVCLAAVGANGAKCCLNPLKCSYASHKHPREFDESNPFFIELVKKSDTATDSAAVSNHKGQMHARLYVNGSVEEKVIARLLEESSDNWAGRFSQLENGDDSNLSLRQMMRADELLRTVVKHRPVIKDASSEIEPLDSDSKSDEMSTLDNADLNGIESWFEVLRGVKSDLEQMAGFGDFTLERKAEEGEDGPSPSLLEDYKLEDEKVKEMAKEIFQQLYTLFESGDAIASFLEVSHKVNKKKIAQVQELVDGLSVLVKSLMSDIGFRSKSSELPSNVWSAVETTALELTGLDASVSKVAMDLANLESKLVGIFDDDDDSEDAAMGGAVTGNDCCGALSGCDCFERLKKHDEKHSETQRHLSELSAKVASVVSENSKSTATTTVHVFGKALRNRKEVSELLEKWFPASTQSLCASYFPTPHLIFNQVWALISNNPSASIGFSETKLLTLNINRRTAESYTALSTPLPMLMTSDGPPKDFTLQSTKKDREGSEAFKSVPTASDFGRKSDSLLYGRLTDALQNVKNKYETYLRQRLSSHPINDCYNMSIQCLNDSVQHVQNVLAFMEDQNYRNVKSFGETKKTVAWNLVCSCVRDIYQHHFKGSLDLLVGDLGDPEQVSIDAIYCSFSLNQLVRGLNKLGIKHHPSVNTSILRFIMESISDLSDSSKQSKKIEDDIKDCRADVTSLKTKLKQANEEVSKLKDELTSNKRTLGDLQKSLKDFKTAVNKKLKMTKTDE